MSGPSAEEREGEAWDALYDTQAARCCDCVSCNHYLPHTEAESEKYGVPMYRPASPCVLRVCVERIVAAREAQVAERIAQAIEARESFAHGNNPASEAHLLGFGTMRRLAARIAREIGGQS